MIFNQGIKLFDAFGIPVYVNRSFLFLLVIFMLEVGSVPLGLAVAVVLAGSVLLHELGHSLVARLYGHATRDITLSLLGGCASLQGMPHSAWGEFFTALAGPLVSFVLSGLCYLGLMLFGAGIGDYLAGLLVYGYYMNLMLGSFNLLPGFPLDGGRVFRSFLRLFVTRAKATLAAMWVGRVVAILLGLSGLMAMVHGGGWGMVRILIAWMIWQEGYREYLVALQEEDFRKWSQADFRARVSPPPYSR